MDSLEKRVVLKQNAENEAGSFGMKYFEISCKLNLNIQEVMNNMILDCYKRVMGVSDVFKLERNGRKERKNNGCCGGGKNVE